MQEQLHLLRGVLGVQVKDRETHRSVPHQTLPFVCQKLGAAAEVRHAYASICHDVVDCPPDALGDVGGSCEATVHLRHASLAGAEHLPGVGFQMTLQHRHSGRPHYVIHKLLPEAILLAGVGERHGGPLAQAPGDAVLQDHLGYLKPLRGISLNHRLHRVGYGLVEVCRHLRRHKVDQGPLPLRTHHAGVVLEAAV